MTSNHYRKCAKCGKTRAEDMSVTYHRFPNPGNMNKDKARAWAKYCWPNKDWTCQKFLQYVHTSNKVLCGRHFNSSKFYDNERQKLSRFAIPDTIEVDQETVEQSSVTGQLMPRVALLQMENMQPTPIVVEPSTLQPMHVPRPFESTEKQKGRLTGLMPPVFTPINEDYSINYGVIPEYALYLNKSGIKSILVGGTTGENMCLKVSDRKKVLDAWLKEAKKYNFHTQVQVGGAPIPDVLELAKYASSAGATSILTLPELYFKPKSIEDLVHYVALVASSAGKLPVYYYHIPGMTNVCLNMRDFVIAATKRIPNFKGLKFTSNDLSEGDQVFRVLKDDQTMFLGADTILAPAALLGIKSSIGTTFNLFPELGHKILKAVENNDIQNARALQNQLNSAVEIITVEGDWVPTMKATMEIVSKIKMGPPCLPQKPISKESRNRIETALNLIKLL